MRLYKTIKNFTELIVIIFLEKVLPKHSPIKNTLMFLNTGFIGDLLVSSVLCENDQLFDKYSRVVFIIKKEYLTLFSNYSGKIRFIGYNYKKYKYSFIYKYSFLSYLRSFGFEKVFNLTAARGILSEEITLLSGAVEKYCLNSDHKYLGKFISNHIEKKYTSVLNLNVMNEYEKHFELLKLFFNSVGAQLNFNNKKTFQKISTLKKVNIKPGNRFIVIAPFSREGYKDWPLEYFRIVIENLRKDYLIILIGTKKQGTSLLKLKNGLDNVQIEAGTLEINEIPSLILKAELFIGLDSGITHMALKLGTPILAIIGGGQFNRFLPFRESASVRYLYNKLDCFNCEWNCLLEQKYNCIKGVRTEDVMQSIDELLKAINR